MRATAGETVLVLSGIFFPTINLVCTAFASAVVYRKKNLHRNCRFLAYSFFCAFLCLSCGDLSMSLILAVIPSCPLPAQPAFTAPNASCQYMAYYRVLMLHGTVIIDTTMVATCIERTLATFILDYEKKPYTMAGCGLVLGAHALAVLSGLGYWSWGLSHAAQSSIMVSLNLVALAYTLLLRRHNKQINNVRRVVGGHLSRRYQLSENVRVLEFLIPWLMLTCVVVGCLTFGIAYAQFTPLQEISITTYFMLLNVYVTVSFVLGARSWIWTYICKHGSKLAAVRVDADTPESHFNALRNMWN